MLRKLGVFGELNVVTDSFLFYFPFPEYNNPVGQLYGTKPVRDQDRRFSSAHSSLFNSIKQPHNG